MGTPAILPVSMVVVQVATTITLLLVMFAPQVSTAYPWVYPGDFRERFRMSDLVVAGTVEETAATGTRIVDGTEVTANVAGVRVDRIFQGEAPGDELRFRWFSPYMGTSGGFVYSGPPLANFRPNHRYLIFLKRRSSGWEVAMPVYALEVELLPTIPRGAPANFSLLPLQQRYQAIADELEAAALAQPAPPPGVTGMAAFSFPSVYDLLGGCAESFYHRFLSSPSPELRRAAQHWLELIGSRHLGCKVK